MAKSNKAPDPKTLDEFKAFVDANGAEKLTEAQSTEYARLLQEAIDTPPADVPAAPSAPPEPSAPTSVTFRAIDGKMVWLHPGIGCPGDGHFVTFFGSYYTTSDPGEIAALREVSTRLEFANIGVFEQK